MTIARNTKNAEQLEFSYTAGGITNAIVFGTQFGIFLWKGNYPYCMMCKF